MRVVQVIIQKRENLNKAFILPVCVCCTCACLPVCVRFLGRPDCPARSGVPWPGPAAETADRKWSVGQHGDGGQHHSAAWSLHTGSSELCPAAAGGRSPGWINLRGPTPPLSKLTIISSCTGKMKWELFLWFFQVDVRTIHGSTPLCNACASGSLECAKLLLEYGAKVNPSLTALTASPLHESCIQGRLSAATRRGPTSHTTSDFFVVNKTLHSSQVTSK